MKKTLTLLAILAAIGPAWGAEVVSSNIVGYEKIQLSAGYNMVGVQFLNVGGEDKSLSTFSVLDDSFEGYDDNYDFPTKMQIWNGNGYDYYGWAGTSGTEVDDDPSLDFTWTDTEAEAVDDVELTASSAVWIKAANAGVMTISGEVPTGTITVNLVKGFNMVANPFPQAIPVTSFGVLDSSFAGYDDEYEFPTKMQVWNGNGYDYYGWAGTSGTEVDDDPSLDNTWTDTEAEKTDAVIPFGGAVWIKAEKAGTITFTSPIAE